MQNVVGPTLIAMATKIGLGAEIKSPTGLSQYLFILNMIVAVYFAGIFNFAVKCKLIICFVIFIVVILQLFLVWTIRILPIVF